MKALRLLLPLAGLLTGCGQDLAPPVGGSGPPPVLPDVFYGEWEHTGTSGGIDGQGVPTGAGKPARIVITRRSTLERHALDGTVVIQPFAAKRGKTIFSVEDQWMLDLALGGGGQ